MSEQYVKVTLVTNYADEFDIESFVIVNKKAVEAIFPAVIEYTASIELYFGTNGLILFTDGEDLLSHLTVQDITQEEFEFFRKFFNEGYIPEYTGVMAAFGVADHFFENMYEIAFPNQDDEI
jgi:hypothetical protein